MGEGQFRDQGKHELRQEELQEVEPDFNTTRGMESRKETQEREAETRPGG